MIPNSSEWLELACAQLWQVTALVVAVGAATRLGCRRRPHLAYALWMLVMFKCLAPPLWSSATGLFSWAQVRTEPPASQMPIPISTVSMESPVPPPLVPAPQAPGEAAG